MIEKLIQAIESGSVDLSNIAVSDCVIPDSVTIIGDGAFLDCTGLTSVTIPNSVTTIGEDAFSGCTGLASVTIPDSVTAIGDDAFYDCTGLTSITIPNSVTNIGVGVFDCCPFLTVYVHNDEHAEMVRELGFEGNIKVINDAQTCN